MGDDPRLLTRQAGRARQPSLASARRWSTTFAAIALVAFAPALSGCKKRPRPRPPAPIASASAAPPPDRALPGELAEGKERAFGFPIPRLMTVTGRFDDVVFASGAVSPQLVVGYVRDRVVDARVLSDVDRTVFDDATLKVAPDRSLRIEVRRRGDSTDIMIRDATVRPAEPGLSNEERWRAVGITPDGQPLDPTHLE